MIYLEPNSTLFYINGRLGKVNIAGYGLTSCQNCFIWEECSKYSPSSGSTMLCRRFYNPDGNEGFIMLSKLYEDRTNADKVKFRLYAVELKSIYLQCYMKKLMSNSAHYNLNK